MKRFLLNLLAMVSMVSASILSLNLTEFKSFSYDTYKGEYEVTLDSEDGNVSFEDSDLASTLLGTAVSDVIDYAGTEDEIASPEFKETVSGNSILNSDNNSLYTTRASLKEYLDNGNINYYVCEREGDSEVIHTNLSNYTQNDEDDVKNLIDSSSIYIYLNGSEHSYESNSLISENTVYKLFENSDYEFPKDTVLAVGLKETPSNGSDGIYEAKALYDNYADYYYIKIAALIICIFIYILSMVILTVSDKKKRTLDSIPIEVRLILLGALAALAAVLNKYHDEVVKTLKSLIVTDPYIAYGILAIIFIIIQLLIVFFYLGFVRRLKNKLILKTSLIGKFVRESYENTDSVLKGIVPSLIVLLLNALCLYFIFDKKIYLLLIALFALDILYIYLNYINVKERSKIIEVIKKICEGDLSAKADEENSHFDNKNLSKAVNNIGNSVNAAVMTSMKDEKMKSDLITNVSHDLKTPLTSIINYVDLLKREHIDNERAVNYINILDEKSQRLKQLTDDLVEASKISSGNIVIENERLNVKELLSMASAEFVDKLNERGLSIVGRAQEGEAFIMADSRSIYRVLENLFTNIYKYALENTRVYVDIIKAEGKVCISIKNISANPLEVSPDELLERFVRGDESRTTEGSGLGLSIAKNLTEAMGGEFLLSIDGDLFKAELVFDSVE